MAVSPEIYSTFSVSCGCLCFGSLHNIWQGASEPVQSFPEVRPQQSGTVKVHHLEYNISAQNRTWNAFQLVDIQTKKVVAWFLANSDVDLEKEIDKVLRVSGSPYEEDSGSRWNNEKTAAEGVFVINRYDWGYYDKRSWDEVGEGVAEGESNFLANCNSLGIVDLAEAKTKVLQWKEQRPSRREWSKGGVWLYIPHSEYMFGRFGFDDEHVAARSFLFFSTYTDFTRTTFTGIQQTLRKAETPEERFERRLREGFDFSGILWIRDMSRQPDNPSILTLSPPPPPAAECLGPYDQSEHVLTAQDIDALRVYRNVSQPHQIVRGIDVTALRLSAPIGEFVEPWKEPSLDLINEMVLSYLERTVLPRMGNRTVLAATEALFPHHTQTGERKHLDVSCYRHFMLPHADPIANFDAAYVSGRIRTFLASRSGDRSVIFDDEYIAGICRVVAYMLTEVFELANDCSRDSERTKIMPCDVRITIFFNCELRDLLQFSKVYWEGRDREPSLVETRCES
jgi:hypothetical protein